MHPCDVGFQLQSNSSGFPLVRFSLLFFILFPKRSTHQHLLLSIMHCIGAKLPSSSHCGMYFGWNMGTPWNKMLFSKSALCAIFFILCKQGPSWCSCSSAEELNSLSSERNFTHTNQKTCLAQHFSFCVHVCVLCPCQSRVEAVTQGSKYIFKVGCQQGISTGQFPLLPPNQGKFSISLLGHVADLIGFLTRDPQLISKTGNYISSCKKVGWSVWTNVMFSFLKPQKLTSFN